MQYSTSMSRLKIKENGVVYNGQKRSMELFMEGKNVCVCVHVNNLFDNWYRNNLLICNSLLAKLIFNAELRMEASQVLIACEIKPDSGNYLYSNIFNNVRGNGTL